MAVALRYCIRRIAECPHGMSNGIRLSGLWKYPHFSVSFWAVRSGGEKTDTVGIDYGRVEEKHLELYLLWIRAVVEEAAINSGSNTCAQLLNIQRIYHTCFSTF